MFSTYWPCRVHYSVYLHRRCSSIPKFVQLRRFSTQMLQILVQTLGTEVFREIKPQNSEIGLKIDQTVAIVILVLAQQSVGTHLNKR